MSCNIMAINPGHNGSLALVSDGELVYFIEEERLSRKKYDGNPFRAIIDVLSKWHVDELIIGGTNFEVAEIIWTKEEPSVSLVRKYNSKVNVTFAGDQHHLGHAAGAFYNSGFDKALSIVVDGAGSIHNPQIKGVTFEGFETESVFIMEYPGNIQVLHKTFGSVDISKADGKNFIFDKDELYDIDSSSTIGKIYESASWHLGFNSMEAGKLMGLAPYGQLDPNIPNLFNGTRGRKDIWTASWPSDGGVDAKNNPYLVVDKEYLWHKDPSKLTDNIRNFAWRVQQETQQQVGDLVEWSINKTGITNVCISGGYGLNCVANYYLKKRFPNVNFYNEPISNDAGTSIGLAKLKWHQMTQDVTKRPQTSLYLGPQHEKIEYDKAFQKYQDKINIKSEVTPKEIAEIISNKNIVAMYQGRSEAGPRALGNRSILYDPRDPKGKDVVNYVKGREWFRPFAGSVLKEKANEWFDLAGMEESPFMMYAVDVQVSKLGEIPAVTHVDGTCRVQTVTPEQNLTYYELIKAFDDLTGVPILFNTSLNLAGEPLVETPEDALLTFFNSKMEYLYFPEYSILITKNESIPA